MLYEASLTVKGHSDYAGFAAGEFAAAVGIARITIGKGLLTIHQDGLFQQTANINHSTDTDSTTEGYAENLSSEESKG